VQFLSKRPRTDLSFSDNTSLRCALHDFEGRRLFDKLRAGDVLVVRWVDRSVRIHEDVCDPIREFIWDDPGRVVSRHRTAAVKRINNATPSGRRRLPRPSKVNDCARSLAAAALKRPTPLVLTVSGRFLRAITLQPKSADAPEGIVKYQLGAAVAVTAIISAAGSALAADLLIRAAAPAHLAQELSSQPSTRSRPPSAEAFEISDRRATLAVATTPPNARDNHVLEFLRWKEQHSAVR
jgi:hypothetical protein